MHELFRMYNATLDSLGIGGAGLILCLLFVASAAIRLGRSIRSRNVGSHVIPLCLGFLGAFFTATITFMLRYNPSVFEERTTWRIIGIIAIILINLLLLSDVMIFARRKQVTEFVLALAMLAAGVSVLTMLYALGMPTIETRFSDGLIMIENTGRGWRIASYISRDISVLWVLITPVVYIACKLWAPRSPQAQMALATTPEQP